MFTFILFVSSNHYKEKLNTMQPNLNSDSVVQEYVSNEKYSIELDDQQTGAEIEETLLRGTGNHIKFRKAELIFRLNI